MINLIYTKYAFDVHIDGEHVGQISASGDDEWASYLVNENGTVQIPRLGTSKDILDMIDDIENAHAKHQAGEAK